MMMVAIGYEFCAIRPTVLSDISPFLGEMSARPTEGGKLFCTKLDNAGGAL
jgi:hypothetical protein